MLRTILKTIAKIYASIGILSYTIPIWENILKKNTLIVIPNQKNLFCIALILSALTTIGIIEIIKWAWNDEFEKNKEANTADTVKEN